MIRPLLPLALGAALLVACGGSDPAPEPDAPTSDDAASVENGSTPTAAPAPAATPTPAAAQPEVDAVLASLPAPYNEANLSRGRRIYQQCAACHVISEDGGHRVGPNLYGLFDRTVGGAAGFRYSNALQEATFTWTPEQLDQWLQGPRTFLPGNAMSFAGVPNPDQRRDVIAYIMVEAAGE